MEALEKIKGDNSIERVRAREGVLNLQQMMVDGIKSGQMKDAEADSTVNHYFAPVIDEYGCGTYAREISMPKGTLVIGKIHRHAHINIISKGVVSVATEHGKRYYIAPCTFVSEVGLKRAVYVEEDTIWTTVHLTRYMGEENLDKVENEVIAESYEDIGLASSEEELKGLGEL